METTDSRGKNNALKILRAQNLETNVSKRFPTDFNSHAFGSSLVSKYITQNSKTGLNCFLSMKRKHTKSTFNNNVYLEGVLDLICAPYSKIGQLSACSRYVMNIMISIMIST